METSVKHNINMNLNHKRLQSSNMKHTTSHGFTNIQQAILYHNIG